VKLVLDTHVMVAAMRSPRGASAEILWAARQGRVVLLASMPLALEHEAVCSRSEHRTAAGLSDREVQVFVTAIVGLAKPVDTHFFWRPQLRDAGDEMVLEVAINGRADALVTFNLRDFGPASTRFGVATLLPRKAVRRIRT
jgi:putative PIN family toxin of toxin-antitoxin system